MTSQDYVIHINDMWKC